MSHEERRATRRRKVGRGGGSQHGLHVTIPPGREIKIHLLRRSLAPVILAHGSCPSVPLLGVCPPCSHTTNHSSLVTPQWSIEYYRPRQESGATAGSSRRIPRCYTDSPPISSNASSASPMNSSLCAPLTTIWLKLGLVYHQFQRGLSGWEP